MHRTAILGTSLLVGAGACGGGDEPRAKREDKAEEQKVQNVVFDFWNSYNRAEPRALCGAMSPTLKTQFARAMAEARPALKGKSCGKLFSSAFRDPNDQPPAVKESSESDFKATTVRGDKATVRFMDGRSWRFEKVAGRWRITAFPILPPSIVRSSRGEDRSLS